MLLIDRGEFHQRLLDVVAPLESFHELVTDQELPSDLARALEQAEVAIHLA